MDQAEERALCHKLFNSYFGRNGEPCEFSTVWDAYCRKIDHGTKIRTTLSSLEIPGSQISRVIEFLRSFQRQKKKRSKIGFGDMITQPLRSLKDPGFRSYIERRFRLLVVDEYQDMNGGQRRLIAKLIRIVDTSVIVGDDGQAIYGFRGAATNAMEQLQYKYRGANLIRLDQSYRLTEETAAFVNAFWAHCGSDIQIKGTGHGPRPRVVCSISRNQMFSKALRTIWGVHAEGTPYDDIAVLATTNRTARMAALYLEEGGIPFTLKGKSGDNDIELLRLFLKTLEPNPLHVEEILVKEVGITRGQAKLMTDLEKDIPVRRIQPRPTDKQLTRSRTIRKAILDIRMKPDLDQILSRFSRVFQGRKAYKWQSIKHVLRTNGIPLSGTPKDLQREIARYLDEKQADNNIPNVNNTGRGVTINTIHGAKGGEWEHVLLLDVYDEAVFQDEHDQSRLFNVGITRPKTQLHLFSLKYESAYKFYQFREVIKYSLPTKRRSTINTIQYVSCLRIPRLSHIVTTRGVGRLV